MLLKPEYLLAGLIFICSIDRVVTVYLFGLLSATIFTFYDWLLHLEWEWWEEIELFLSVTESRNFLRV